MALQIAFSFSEVGRRNHRPVLEFARGLAVVAMLALLSLTVTGQTLQPTVMYSFPSAPQGPSGSLLLGTDGGIYGTTSAGGTNGGFGTMFRISTNGTVSTVFSFGSSNANPSSGIVLESSNSFIGLSANGGDGFGTMFELVSNDDSLLLSESEWNIDTMFVFPGLPGGANPTGSVAILGGTYPDFGYYGTTAAGGSSGYGGIFELGGNLETGRIGPGELIASFNKTNGANPQGGLTSDYGTTANGGAYGYGTLFSFTITGTITTLVSFNKTNGANPVGGMFYTNSILYGTTSNGGAYGCGTIFQYSGSTLTTLASFNNTNGAGPCGTLWRDKYGNIFGTTSQGGTNGGFGTIFELTSGGVLTSLFSFGLTNGAYPLGNLVQAADGNLYGTTSSGGPGAGGCGTIFRITTNNGIFTSLASFNNALGAGPLAPLLQGTDGNLYGTTSIGGTNGGGGTIFQETTNGEFTSLVSFNGTDGYDPIGGLLQASDGTLWGTTYEGGTNGNYGTIFQATTNGALTSIISFNGSNGANPCAGVTLGPDGNFYGTTFNGGSHGYGTIFQITSNGSLTSLVSFNETNGANPYAGLTLGSDGNFYGTTFAGGTNGYGTVFKATTSGTLTSLYSFSSSEGHPYAALVQGSDGNFYGTTSDTFKESIIIEPPVVDTISGTVFKITTNGVFTTVLEFDNEFGITAASPRGSIIQGTDGNLYLTTSRGGSYDAGEAISLSIKTDQTIQIISFDDADGALPFAGLMQASDGNFYGTTAAGGANGGGTVFRLNSYPTIASQTQSPTVQCGNNATFSVSAVAMVTPFTYQWYLNNTALTNGPGVSGANASTLTLSDVTLADSGGSYSVVVSNFIGSATSQTSVLTVIDTLPPVITLNGSSPTNIALNSVFIDPGATAYDNCAGVVPVTTNGTVNTAIAGAYTLTYTATDPSGNSATNTRTVNVLAPSPVQFTLSEPGLLAFPTVTGQSYTIQQSTNLASTNWCYYTNFIGAGVPWQFTVPTNQVSSQFFRVREP